MNQDESNEQQERPPVEQAAPGVNPTQQPDNRFRSRGPRRPNRGGRRDNRGDRGPRPDRNFGPEGGQPRGNEPRRASGNIGQAIEQVEHIRLELNKVMVEINDVMETLEIAEREKTASEQEIDKLRDSLRSLHREPSYPRPQRNFPAPPPRPQMSTEPPVSSGSPDERSEDSDD